MAWLAYHGWYIRKQENRPVKVVKATLIVACFWSFVCLIMASIVSGGLAKTCSEFEKNDQHSSCGAIFGYGFHDNDLSGRGKNINTISAAATCGWIMMLCWIAMSAFEYRMMKQASNVWWTSL